MEDAEQPQQPSNEPSSKPDKPAIRASDADRERVAKILHEAMGEGRLDTNELDERLGTLYAAKTLDELTPLTADLPVAQPQRPTPMRQAPATEVTHRIGGTPTSSVSFAIMGGSDRRGPWVVSGRYTAVAVMGGVDIDLTEASFAEPETTITVFAMMGGVDIIVPDDITVRVDGIGLLGSFENKIGDQTVPGGPVVRITGLALMGGVEVKRPRRRRWGRNRLER